MCNDADLMDLNADPEAKRNFTIEAYNRERPEESEDCLYLNVYAPSSKPPGKGRAVMYWIYGGSLTFGTASLSTYNGSSLAVLEDVVVVTMNYRTNGEMPLSTALSVMLNIDV